MATLSSGNNYMRARPEKDPDELLALLKDIKVHADSVEVRALTWTEDEFGTVTDLLAELRSSMETVKKKRYQVAESHQKAIIVVERSSGIEISMGALRQVVMSEFLSAEDLGRLACTSKNFTENLANEDSYQLALQTAQSERLDFVPRYMVAARGWKFMYDQLMPKDDTNDDDTHQMLPTTLSAENLTILLKIHDTDGVEVYSKELSSSHLGSLQQDNSADFSLPRAHTQHAALLERIGTSEDNHHDYELSDLKATIYGFRRDTKQLARLMHCQGNWDEGDSLQFQGHEFVSFCIFLQICPPDDDDDDATYTLSNLFHPQNAVNHEPDPLYTFFRALHNSVQWKG